MDRDVPLHVEIQAYIDRIMAVAAMYDIERQDQQGGARIGLPDRCPECGEQISDQRDHETGCSNWGALLHEL